MPPEACGMCHDRGSLPGTGEKEIPCPQCARREALVFGEVVTNYREAVVSFAAGVDKLVVLFNEARKVFTELIHAAQKAEEDQREHLAKLEQARKNLAGGR